MIRPFDETSEADYVSATALHNAVTPEYPTTAEEMRDEDSRRDPHHRHGRWLMVTDSGGVVGLASYHQNPWIYHPRRFNVSVKVLPSVERQGIGSALYNHLLDALAPFDPLDLHADIREDKTRAVRFAQDRGFVEEVREWESRLDVRAFDPVPWAGARERPARSGVVLRSYRALSGDPDRDRKLHALESQTFLDMPTPVTLTPVPFETFERAVLQAAHFLPDGLLIAVETATGSFVGSTNLSRARTVVIWRRA
ncbi:MAG: GNAT family N-acetyltransferase [Cytophagales bacterium]|nr:GNAT family N-acetyltransferase [Armatimonadota bacterium]